MFKIHSLGILITLLLGTINAKRDYIISFTEAHCEQNTSILKSHNCRLESLPSKGGFSGYFQFRESVVEISAHATVELYKTSQRNLTLLDLKVDGCTFFESLHNHMFVKKFKKLFLRYVNVYPKCPLKANFNFTILNFQYDEELFPKYAPEAKFRGTLRLFFNKDQSRSLFIDAIAEVISKKKLSKIIPNSRG